MSLKTTHLSINLSMKKIMLRKRFIYKEIILKLVLALPKMKLMIPHSSKV